MLGTFSLKYIILLFLSQNKQKQKKKIIPQKEKKISHATQTYKRKREINIWVASQSAL
jgi:hypothetical protein